MPSYTLVYIPKEDNPLKRYRFASVLAAVGLILIASSLLYPVGLIRSNVFKILSIAGWASVSVGFILKTKNKNK